MKKHYSVLIGLLICISCWGQTKQQRKAIDKIASLQVVNDPFYSQGLFTSQRRWFSSSTVEDNNVFVTSSLAFMLMLIHEKLNTDDSTINAIIRMAKATFPMYANRNGEVTYNFWQTIGEDLPFPNNRMLMRERFRLPDDYDDTVIIELVKDDSISSARVREKMVSYALRADRKPVKETPKKYREYQAYEVLFADKMDNQYDIIVMCNILSFVFRNQYELNETDSETIRLIKHMVNDGDHMKIPNEIATWYGSSSWILYHLVRMMTFESTGIFNDLRPLIISDIQKRLIDAESEMEKVILYSSLAKLGVSFTTDLNEERLLAETKTFLFFQFKPNQMLGILPTMKWKSEALNWTLILEYMVISGTDINF